MNRRKRWLGPWRLPKPYSDEYLPCWGREFRGSNGNRFYVFGPCINQEDGQ